MILLFEYILACLSLTKEHFAHYVFSIKYINFIQFSLAEIVKYEMILQTS